MFTWSSLPKPTIVLSPMAGYTDSAFKQTVRMLCPEAVLVTEFVSADAVYYGSKKTLHMMAFHPSEHPVILQVFGKNPDRFVHAAKIAQQMGYDGIDINMGCPAKKVIHSDHGSALVKIENRCTAMKIVSDMAQAVKIPVSVKTRLGWENAHELVDFCKELEKNGCSSIAIHGRTTKQGYRGDANWDPIYEVKRQVNIPIFGNGDITGISSFRKKLGNLDGVFVGRASFGDPWIIPDLCEYIKNRSEFDALSDDQLDQRFPRGEHIPWEKKKPVALAHLELSVKTKGESLGVLEMRKHFAAYIKGLEGAKEMREKIMSADTTANLEKIINSFGVPDTISP